MRLQGLVAVSRAVAESPGRLAKIQHLSSLLSQSSPDDIPIAVSFLSGSVRQRRLGVGGAAIAEVAQVPPAAEATLTLHDVDGVLERVAAIAGEGSNAQRASLLKDLFRRATADEQDFLARLLYGELRQGALEGVLVDAVARAAGVPAAKVRRAAMLEGALPPVALRALTGGEDALDAAVLRPLQPIQPMLAESAADVPAALEQLEGASLEYKLDGARIQAHKRDGEVCVFSRTLREVTAAVPEVVEALRALPSRDAILDGEVISLKADGTPHPFQVTMRRFGRKLDVERLRAEQPLVPFFFDALYLDGAPLIDEPLSARIAALNDVAGSMSLVPRIVPASADEAEAFAKQALAQGHEGVMAKALASRYAAGRRGSSWLKIKQARTLDLVVLAVEWGSGRRRGWLSNLHLGARDSERGGFVMLGKTFKGLSDEMLAWQTTRLLALEIARDRHVVHVKPELVVEIAFNDLQASPHYPGGLALRFARVKRYRDDKTAAEADSFRAVQEIYRQMTGYSV
jgi:DNA ligase-1